MNTYTANIHIRELPRVVDNMLTMLANKRGVPKWEVVREALMAYASNHQHEILTQIDPREIAILGGEPSL